MKNQNLALYDVLVSPLVSDKSYKLQNSTSPVYTFVVSSDADKARIKRAVEKIFNVEVKCVNVQNKETRSRSYKGKRAVVSKKIAYISLKSGSINYDI